MTAQDRERAVDEIYRRVLGENLHLGTFERPGDSLRVAMARTNDVVADALSPASSDHILDAGCGHGGMARHLARHFGCHVTAVNLSEPELARAEAMTAEAGLTDKVQFEKADLTNLPFADGEFDRWLSQDALLHVPEKRRALSEAFRTLNPGGRLILTDLLLGLDVPDNDRRHLYKRIKSGHLWPRADYVDALAELGFENVETEDWSDHVAPTYMACRNEIQRCRAELEPILGAAFLDTYADELQIWIDAADSGKIGWGLFVAERPA